MPAVTAFWTSSNEARPPGREHPPGGAEPVRQPGQHGGLQPELIRGKIKIRQNG